MNLEERVERLEHFMGDMEHIATLYANSVQEICDKYLSLLYIEEIDPSHTNYLRVDGYLGTIGDDPNTIPRNVVFNIRASHDYEEDPNDPGKSYLVLSRDGVDCVFPLKKYNIDPDHQGELIFLEDHDFRNGSLYGVYIDSQGIAVMSANDAGDAALNEVRRLSDVVTTLESAVQAIAPSSGEIAETTGNITNVTSDTITTQNLTTDNLYITNPVNLPSGSTAADTSSPNDESTRVANNKFVWNAIREYHRRYHKKGTGDPLSDPSLMADSPEGGLYYQY